MDQLFVNRINDKILCSIDNKQLPLGLFWGKMGFCVYFYLLEQYDRSDKYKSIVEKILEQVINQLHTVKAIDIETGLSGIGIAIDFLVRKGYVKGDINTILSNIDDEIFKQICFQRSNKDTQILIQILFYIYIRKQSTTKESDTLFDELTIYIINILHQEFEHILENNDIMFSIYTKLPLCLYVLGKVYELNIYNLKIAKMISEITPLIISKYPFFDSSKLQLLWGISNFNKQVKDERLSQHCKFIASQIDIDNLINEFYDKNMFFEHGLAGVALLMATTYEDEKKQLDTSAFLNFFLGKIKKSAIWQLTDTDLLEANLGLWGYCGMILVTHKAQDLL